VVGHRRRILLANAEIEAGVEVRTPDAKGRGETQDAPVVPPDGRCACERRIEERPWLKNGMKDEHGSKRMAGDRPAVLSQGMEPGEFRPERAGKVFHEAAGAAARGLVRGGGRRVVAPPQVAAPPAGGALSHSRQ